MLIIVAQESAAPATQAVVPPAPAVPSQPSPISTQAPAPKTADDLVAEYASGTGNRDELAKQIYSLPIPRQRILDAILTAYKSGRGVDDIISHLLYGFPEENFGTVGRWLESATKKKGENPKEKAQEAIWTALNKSVPGTPPPKDLWGQLAGQYKGLKVQEMGGGQHGKKTQVGGNKKYFAPYLLFLQNPDAPPAGARPIDADLIDAMDNGRLDEDRTVWEQYKRDWWHDKDEQGPGRVERAKKWWLDTLASPSVAAVVAALPEAERPTERGSNLKTVENMLAARNSESDPKVDSKIKAIFKQKGGKGIPENLGIDFPRLATLYLRDNPNKAYFSMPNFLPWFAEKMKALAAAGEMPESASQPQVNLDWFNKAKVAFQRAGVDSAAWTDPKSPNFLNAEMVDPSRMGTGPQYVKDVRDAMRSRTLSVNMDYDDKGKGRTGQDPSIGDVDVAEKPAIVNAPQIAEERKLKKIEPLIDPAKNPDFEPMIEYVAKRLYRPENLDLDSPDGRLSKVLYDIGMMFSESQGTRTGMPSGAAKQIQQRNWENNKTTFLMLEEEGFLDHPLPLRVGEDNLPEVNEDDPMYDEESARGVRKQRYEMANRQFRADMVEFLSNPRAQAEMFRDLGLTPQKAVAVMSSVRLIALANSVRMATEKVVRRIVTASALPKEAGEIERVIDSLFGHGPRSMIARIVMRNGGNLDQATMKGVREAVEKNFPKEYKRLKSSMFSLVNGILSDIMGFLQAEGKNPVAIPVVQEMPGA